MWTLKNDANELFTKQKQTDRLREQTYGYQRGTKGGEGLNQESGINTYSRLYTKQIINKDLLGGCAGVVGWKSYKIGLW